MAEGAEVVSISHSAALCSVSSFYQDSATAASYQISPADKQQLQQECTGYATSSAAAQQFTPMRSKLCSSVQS